MKKIICALLVVALCFGVAGCGNDDGIEKIDASSDYASVYIKQSFNWDEKTNEEKMEFAKYAVEESFRQAGEKRIEGLKKAFSEVGITMTKEEEEEHLNEGLNFVWGYYGEYPDRRKVFIYDKDKYPDITIDETIIAAENAKAQAKTDEILATIDLSCPSNISRIDLFGIENGIAYYDAYVTNSFDWNNADFYDQGKLAEETIEACRDKAKNENATSFEVMGFLSDGYNAFSWRGGNTVKLYINGIYKDNYLIS